MRTYSQISMYFDFAQLSFCRKNCVFYKVATIIQFSWRHKETRTGGHKIASYAQKRIYEYWDTANNTSLVHFMGTFVLKTYFRCNKAAKTAAIHFFCTQSDKRCQLDTLKFPTFCEIHLHECARPCTHLSCTRITASCFRLQTASTWNKGTSAD